MTCARCGEDRAEERLEISLGALGVREVTQLAPCACVRRTLAFLAQPVAVAAPRSDAKPITITSARRRRVATQEES